MSFILDALKKSETERQQQGPSDFANVPSSAESPRAPRWLWVLAALLAAGAAKVADKFRIDILRNGTKQSLYYRVAAFDSPK